jgi:alpha-1,2-mannosyltransferase
MDASGSLAPARYGLSRVHGVGIVAAWMVVLAALYVRWVHSTDWNFVDLADFYYGGVSVRDGVDIYAPRPGVLAFNYPPFAAVVFLPLALIGLTATKVVFSVATLLAYAVSLLAIRRASGARWGTTLLVGAAGLALEPVVRVLVLGQVGVILMAVVLADCFLVPPRYRGLLTGVAAGIKLTPALFVLFFILRRDWHSVTRAGAAGLATIAVGWAAAPLSSQRYWLGGFDKLDRFGGLAFTPVNQSVTSLVSRTATTSGAALWVAVAVAALAALACTVLLARRGRWPGVVLSLAAATLLLSPISWTHHWVWVVPAMMVLAHTGHGLLAAMGAIVFYVAPMWLVPEAGPLDAVGLLLGYAYLFIAGALLVATIVRSLPWSDPDLGTSSS